MKEIIILIGEIIAGSAIGCIIGGAIWDLWLKKALFPNRFKDLLYVIDLSLKHDDETFDEFIDRANDEDLGEYKLV